MAGRREIDDRQPPVREAAVRPWEPLCAKTVRATMCDHIGQRASGCGIAAVHQSCNPTHKLSVVASYFATMLPRILSRLTRTPRTQWPRAVRHAPDTLPTYPEPTMVMFK